MKRTTGAVALAAAMLLCGAGAAEAAVGISFSSADAAPLVSKTLVWNFDDVQLADYTVAFSTGSGLRKASAGVTSTAAPPPGATGYYAAVRKGGTMTLSTPGISALSVFMGSPDSYNSLRFNYLDGTSEILNGIQLAGGAFNGDQKIGRYMTYIFDKTVNSVVFGSSGDSFEFDNIAVVAAAPGVVSAVPEPQTWALMIGGFALVGAALRRRPRMRAELG